MRLGDSGIGKLGKWNKEGEGEANKIARTFKEAVCIMRMFVGAFFKK
jgi:hypothetical protein